MAVAWPLLLAAVFFPLSLHRYRRLSPDRSAESTTCLTAWIF